MHRRHGRSALSALVLFAVVLAIAAGCDRPRQAALSEQRRQIDRYARRIGSAAVLVQQNDRVVYSYGDVRREYMCHSIRKPLLGALYGIYVERGVIDLDLTLAELEIDDIPPELSAAEKRATVGDLLLSRSGVYHAAAGEAPSMIAARPSRGSHRPGTFFYYNNWDFNALGTIFTRLTGLGVFEAFEKEIAGPLGMEDFSRHDGTYVYEPGVSRHPAYFFRMSTRDLALFGSLYAHLGTRHGRELVTRTWIEESTRVRPVSNPGGDPYGYLWRIIPPEAGLGYGFYHAGLGVHLLAVLPDHRLVLVHRVDTDRPFDTTWPEVKQLLEMIADTYGLLSP